MSLENKLQDEIVKVDPVGPGLTARLSLMGEGKTGQESNELSRRLRGIDADGDGIINEAELIQFVEKEIHEAHQLKRARTGVCLMGTLLAVAVLANVFLTYSVVELTKETKVASDGKLLGTDGNAIMVENTDSLVHDGQLVTRNGSAVTVGVAVKENPLSSRLSDTLLHELRHIRLYNDVGGSLDLTVFGFVRMPKKRCDGTLSAESVVKFFTSPGLIELDDTELTFTDLTTTKVFEDAGFNTAPVSDSSGRRRLLSLTDLVGFFNLVDSFDTLALEYEGRDGTTIFCEDRNLFQLPDSYHLQFTGYNPCQVPDDVIDYCIEQGAVSLPGVPGLYLLEDLEMWEEEATNRSKIMRKTSWDPRWTVMIVDRDVGVEKRFSLIGQKGYGCSLRDTITPSIFDMARVSNARVEAQGGLTLYEFTANIKMTANYTTTRLMRLWQDSGTGELKRFQPWNTEQPGTYFYEQRFYEVNSFEETTFEPDFWRFEFADHCDADRTLEPRKPPPTRADTEEFRQWAISKGSVTLNGTQFPFPPDSQASVSPSDRRYLAEHRPGLADDILNGIREAGRDPTDREAVVAFLDELVQDGRMIRKREDKLGGCIVWIEVEKGYPLAGTIEVCDGGRKITVGFGGKGPWGPIVVTGSFRGTIGGYWSGDLTMEAEGCVSFGVGVKWGPIDKHVDFASICLTAGLTLSPPSPCGGVFMDSTLRLEAQFGPDIPGISAWVKVGYRHFFKCRRGEVFVHVGFDSWLGGASAVLVSEWTS